MPLVPKTPFLQESSGRFPRFDWFLCSWFTRGICLKNNLGTRIQAFIEKSIVRGLHLCGRPLLKLAVREFDLDAALAGLVSSVALFQIS